MSSAGAPGAAAPLQRYFCHQCDRTVTLTVSPGAEIACPICHGGFVEELDFPDSNPNPSSRPFSTFQSSDPFFFSPSAFPFLFPPTSPSASFDLRNPSDLVGLFGPDSFPSAAPGSGPGGGPEPFNPLVFLQNHIQQLLSGGANIQVVLEGGPGLGGSLGDYFIGPGLEQLIQQLAENDPNRYGTPPAAKSAISSLPDIKITEELLASDEAQCAVCKDTFEIGVEAKQMPCKHIYHKDCILPWLELHNSCPVCRYELLTDDPDYENKRGAAAEGARPAGAGDPGGAGGSAAGASGDGNTLSPRTVERRFRISLPWPLRGFGSQAEASNTGGGGGNDGGSSGGTAANSSGGGNTGSETRQDDLD
ncbi:E3 ubiquitin-protein ligase RING1 [Phoenix dactylifera]|uniref:RING-type E3 ubiquitin transferase n=1 Tax=Phoenix dactylifera TaxID=42345 RepID=A0A8B8ZIS2_PHODC|nr:E3 ubiquitin-protein ligase RING1 [Phoenix dactylifera]XP_038971353.1 E3 ubiquitin-protein ligase RING1 [Phoenix dactylifera]XP_038971354.1 E3 ubiquitin-protein ligase RING1 [Phoenix dactylifera]